MMSVPRDPMQSTQLTSLRAQFCTHWKSMTNFLLTFMESRLGSNKPEVRDTQPGEPALGPNVPKSAMRAIFFMPNGDLLQLSVHFTGFLDVLLLHISVGSLQLRGMVSAKVGVASENAPVLWGTIDTWRKMSSGGYCNGIISFIFNSI